MAVPAWMSYFAGDTSVNGPLAVQERILAALATIASGMNPDGTPSPAQGGIDPGDILNGFQTFAATTAATTIITIPAGETWQGNIFVSCAAGEVGAGAAQPQATAIISTAGAGAIPAAGNWIRVDAVAGANVAAGTVGDGATNAATIPFVAVAPAGNSITIQAASTNVGTFSQVSVSAIGIST